MSCYKGSGIRFANMLQSTMQGGVLERKRYSSEIGDDKFEEMVSTPKLVPFPLP